ncbi:MAG: tRNA methyltransferase 9 [Trebouxia sp. A1-2]|nr:MAG: tRNA methyltransferase 9 [Trebouxia sp. A1-2]
MFGKPKGGQPTRHLFVGNCGPGVGVDQETLTQLFGQYGTATVTVPEEKQNPHSAFVFVSYGNTEEAIAALSALNNKPCAQAHGRRFVIKHADLKKDQEKSQRPVALSTQDCTVPGLTLIKDIVSREEEQALLNCAEEGQWETLARRRVCHFGYSKAPNGVHQGVALVADVPCWLWLQVDQCTVNEYSAGVGLSPHIDTHSAFTGAIASLSLAGPAVMEFRQGGECEAVLLPPRSLLIMAGPARYCWHHYIPHRKADPVQGHLLPRAPRRTSFTFRKVRGYPCDCQWPEHCDSQQSQLPPTRMALKSQMPGTTSPGSQPSNLIEQCTSETAVSSPTSDLSSSATSGNLASPTERHLVTVHGFSNGQKAESLPIVTPAATLSGIKDEADAAHGKPSSGQHTSKEADLQRMEQEFVHDVYNAIAPHFSSTRFAIWPKVRQFIDKLAPGSLVADVGCGNGKYFLVRQDIAVLGSDRSSGLAEVAATRLAAGTGAASGSSFKADVAVADGMQLPYASHRFDAVLSIAVLHHITTPARRIHMLKELLRILRPAGKALVTVWATHQEDMKKLAKWQPIDRPGSHAQDATTDHHLEGSAMSAAVTTSSLISPSGVANPSLGTDQADEAGASKQQLAAEVNGSRDAQSGSAQQASVASPSSSQDQSAAPSNDYFVPWHLPFHRAEAAMQVLKASSQDAQKADPAAAGSIRIDNKKNSVVFSRYYHVYEQFELDNLVQQVPGAEVLESFYDKDNWCVVMGKVAVPNEKN